MGIMDHLWSLVRGALLIVTLIFTIIGTAGSQYKYSQGSTTREVFFYEFVTTINGNKVTTKVEKPDGCADGYNTNQAAYAFAIISCIVVAAALGLTIAEVFVAKIPRIASIAATGVFAVTSLLAWAISEGYRNGKYCNASSSLKDSKYDIDYGLALMIVAWILSLAATAIGVVFGLILKKGVAVGAASTGGVESTEANV